MSGSHGRMPSARALAASLSRARAQSNRAARTGSSISPSECSSSCKPMNQSIA